VSITRGVAEGNRNSAVPWRTVCAAPARSASTAPATTAQTPRGNRRLRKTCRIDLGYGRRGGGISAGCHSSVCLLFEPWRARPTSRCV